MKKLNLFYAFSFAIILFSCQKENLLKPDSPQIARNSHARISAIAGFTSAPYASGLIAPLGMALDDKGRIWVTENGAGANDGKVKVISPNGSVTTAISGFNSIIDPFEGLPAGLTHLAIRDEKLYILHGVEGKLFIMNIDDYSISQPPKIASSLIVEDLSTFIKGQDLTLDNNSNVYNLTFGKTGDIFIADAGANAIIKRDKQTKALSVFAKIPGHQVPANPFGIPFTDAVPTGIVWDGDNFLVSTLGGFPFSEAASPIFQISPSGSVSVYASGFSTLTDICLTPQKEPLVLQFSKFVFAPPTFFGFQPFMGRIQDASGSVLLANLMFPTSLIRGESNYFVLSTALGTVAKLTAFK